jgi:hypothetical protein
VAEKTAGDHARSLHYLAERAEPAASIQEIMSDTAVSTCSACGQPVTGKFCSHCGAAAGPRSCAACRADLSPQARFCHRCGTPAAGTPGSVAPARAGAAPGSRTPWMVACGIALVLLSGVGALVWSERPKPTAPDMANAGNVGAGGPAGSEAGAAPFAGPGVPAGRAPDISQMSSRERFDRLFNRVMEAVDRRDSAFVVNFTPMALGAYSQLDSVNVDSRYHAAVLHMQVGDFAAALALADTIEAEEPTNLLVPIVRGTVAELQNQPAVLEKQRQIFLSRYDAEMAKNRPEYLDHRPILDGFRKGTPSR